MKNIPKKIYLQIGEDAELAEDFSELSEEDIAWSTDRIFDNDIEYSRSGWIPCKERLPERQENTRYSQVPCLVFKNNQVFMLVFNHEHECWDDESGDDYYCDIYDVSHWMPLPEPPKKGE